MVAKTNTGKRQINSPKNSNGRNKKNNNLYTATGKKKNPIFYIRKDWQLYLLLVLPLLFAFLFKYGPMAGLVISFKDYKIIKGFWDSKWIGFDVFKDIFGDKQFWLATRNTLLLNGLTLLAGFPVPIMLSLLLNELTGKYFKRITQTILYLPHFLSWVVIGALAYQIFGYGDGAVNNLLEAMGTHRIPFLQEDVNWLISYVLINVWQSMGWSTIIYLSAISGVNVELYEAATVDGAGRWHKMLYVTLPAIRGTIVTLLIMNLGKVMGGSFETVDALSNVATTEFTRTIPVLVYRTGILNGKYSESTAIGLFQSIIGLILVLATDRIAKKLGEDGLI